MRRTIPLLIVMVGGIMMMIQFFIPHQASQAVFSLYTDYVPVIGGFALILGVGSLTRVHYHKVRRRAENWQYSLLVLIFLYLMPLFGIILPASVGGQAEGPSVFHFLYNYAQIPIQSTMFSLLAFYIASAAFRAFRARSAMATVLMLAAIIVMMGQVPIGDFLGKWFPATGLWILRFPNLAGKRAIQLGVGFGILATNLKIIFGVERNWLGGAGK